MNKKSLVNFCGLFHLSENAIRTLRNLPHRFARNCRVLQIVLLLVFIASPASALGFRLGAQVSSDRTSFSGDLPDEGSWEARASLGAGVVAEMTVTSDVAVSFQPSYAPRNSRQVFEEWGEVIESIDYDLNYVSLPLIVRVTADPVGVRGFVTAGLDLGVLIDATKHTESGSEDITDDFTSTTIGALFGAGAMVPVKRHFLTFEFRYKQGFDNILTGGGGNTDIASPSVKYKGFSLLVGFLFTLGGE
jgi:hypothetical protein